VSICEQNFVPSNILIASVYILLYLQMLTLKLMEPSSFEYFPMMLKIMEEKLPVNITFISPHENITNVNIIVGDM